MNLKSLLMLGLLALAGNLSAQTATSVYAVHFNSDEYQLDEKDKAILENLVTALTGPDYAELSLTAHTDFVADANYNQKLSEQRCASVKNFLIARGVASKRITEQSFGEFKPKVNSKTEQAKALNRRVECELQVFKAGKIQDFLLLIDGNQQQQFKVNPNKPIQIKGKNGLQLSLPANAFVDENNMPIKAQEISIQIEELFGPREAFTHQLSTISDGKLLESGGMFSVEATLKGKPLKLKEEASMEVKLPSKNLKEGMQVFTSVENASTGIKEWKVSNTAFEIAPEKKVDLPFVYFDTTALRSYKVKDIQVPSFPDFKYGCIPWPIRPNCPKAPHKPQSLSKQDMFSFAERIFYSNSYMDDEVKEANDRRDKSYEKALNHWVQRSIAYENNLLKYYHDSAAFEFATRDTFVKWVTAKEEELQEFLAEKEKQFFNEGIEKFCRASAKKQLSSLNLRSVFMSYTRPNKSMAWQLDQLKICLDFMDRLKESSMAEVIALAGDKKNMINISPKYMNRHMNYYRNTYRNKFAAEMLNNNDAFENLFIEAEDEVYALREKAGLLDNKDVSMVYTASLNATGLFNCDRFSNVPPMQMAKIRIEAPKDSRVSFYLPAINAYVYAYHDEHGYYANLPKGKSVKMLAFNLNEKAEPLLAQADFLVKEDVKLNPILERVSVKELRQSLANI
jgi:hypothetical protein